MGIYERFQNHGSVIARQAREMNSGHAFWNM